MSISEKAYHQFLKLGIPKSRNDAWIYFPTSKLQNLNTLTPLQNNIEALGFDLGIETEKNIAALIPLFQSDKIFVKTIDKDEIAILKPKTAIAHSLFHIQNKASVSFELLNFQGSSSLQAERLDFFLEEDTKLELFFAPEGLSSELAFKHIRVFAKAGASVQILGLQKSIGTYRYSFDVILEESKSLANFRLLNLLNKNTEAHYYLNIYQNAPDTWSHQLVKNILYDKTHVAYEGAVHIAPNCPQANSDQLINSILFSDESKVSIKPVLKIYHDDVSCTHGNTCGELDKDTLYYLQARGIDLNTSKKILIQSFMASTFEGLEKTHALKQILKKL